MKNLISTLFFLQICSSNFAQIVQVKDIYVDFSNIVNNANPAELFDYNNTLFFRADSGAYKGLWRSDGTSNGTVLVAPVDMSTETVRGFGYNFTPFNGLLYFTGGSATFNNGTNDIELWKTDGSFEGTSKVKDIRIGISSSYPDNLVVLNSTTMIFQASDSTTSTQLWKTDGTEAGTVKITDYTSSNSILWIKKLGSSAVMCQGLYSNSMLNPLGYELYKTNGSIGNNELVKNINPGIINGISNRVTISALGSVFFNGNAGTTGMELWKTDGTEAGTVLVKDIYAGTSTSEILRFASLGNNIYFCPLYGSVNRRPWKSDGTTAGTVPITLNTNVSVDNDSSFITSANGKIYFFALEGATFDLYCHDGLTTTKLLDCNANGINLSNLYTNFVALNGYVYFSVDSNSDTLTELWRTDGTATGTVQVASLFSPIVNPSGISNITVSNNKIFFSGVLNNGNELMMFDPSTLKVSINDKLKQLSVYPNPSNGTIYVDYDFNEIAEFSITSILGSKVDEGKIENKSITTALKSGIYILEIKSENKVFNKKIVIN